MSDPIISDDELCNAFFEEWERIESFRQEMLLGLLDICKKMHIIRGNLAEGMVQVLVEADWKEGEVTKYLADGCVGILRAIKALERKKTMEEVMTDGVL